MNGMGSGAGTATGAASGAAMGTAIMPGIGTLIGAGVGAASGAYADNEAEKKEQAANPRPKHRRWERVMGNLNALKQQQMAAKMSVAQSAFEFGSSLRY